MLGNKKLLGEPSKTYVPFISARGRISGEAISSLGRLKRYSVDTGHERGGWRLYVVVLQESGNVSHCVHGQVEDLGQEGALGVAEPSLQTPWVGRPFSADGI